MRFRVLTMALVWLCCCFAHAGLTPIRIKATAPSYYVVQPGDTIVSIACRYLVNPGQWTRVYSIYSNNHGDLNYIYPGDILRLQYINGQPRIVKTGRGTLVLSPTIRKFPLDKAIPTIPFADLKPFMRGALIISKHQLDCSPYVLTSIDDHDAIGSGEEIYAKNFATPPVFQDYSIYRKGKLLCDPPTGRPIGYQADQLGQARLLRYLPDGLAVMIITDAKKEIEAGDRLWPEPVNTSGIDFYPTEPNHLLTGQIISVIGDVSALGQQDVVIINRGNLDGVKRGNVLAIYEPGRVVEDPVQHYTPHHWYDRSPHPDLIGLPEHRIGAMIIINVNQDTSIGLIIESTQEIHVLDHVTNPT